MNAVIFRNLISYLMEHEYIYFTFRDIVFKPTMQVTELTGAIAIELVQCGD